MWGDAGGCRVTWNDVVWHDRLWRDVRGCDKDVKQCAKSWSESKVISGEHSWCNPVMGKENIRLCFIKQAGATRMLWQYCSNLFIIDDNNVPSAGYLCGPEPIAAEAAPVTNRRISLSTRRYRGMWKKICYLYSKPTVVYIYTTSSYRSSFKFNSC